jgi:hypothetical protein
LGLSYYLSQVIPYLLQVIPPLFGVEIITAAAVILLGLLLSRGPSVLTGAFDRFAHRRALACLTIALGVLAIRAALLPVIPIPDPLIRDEFSHLFGAETYASGRVANPTHPKWVHFEAPYTIQRPTAVSAYPPGQALALAFGIVFAGHAWWGVWLATGLLCGAICWALQGWLPPRWALFGAIVAALRFGLLSYWMNSYWGGSVPALGGALALGALPRLRQGRPRIAVVFALGLAIIVVARPYEGIVTALAICIAVLWMFWRKPAGTLTLAPQHVLSRRFLLPAGLVVLMSGAGMVHYCVRTTGSLEIPYFIFNREYWGARHFIPMDLPPEREYRHDVFRAMAVQFRREHLEARSVRGFVKRNVARALFWWPFYCGPVLSIFLLLGWRAFLDRRIRPLLLVGLIFAIGLSIEVPRMPHYAAPFTAAWMVIWVQTARHTAHLRYGRGMVRLIPLALTAVLLYRLAEEIRNPAKTRQIVAYNNVLNWCCVPTNGVSRGEIERYLEQRGGPHLVFFQLPADRMRAFDWVYNKPDIDRAEIVWARAMSPAKNLELCDYYPERRAWFVDATLSELTIRPYCLERGTLETGN